MRRETATLVGDLGAESIDFLDIVFRLEKSFAIEIPRAELFPEDILTNAEYVQDGKVTGRPVDLLVATDGALLLSDDHAGVVYRISYGSQ